jgi:hypothetical protein
MTHTPNDDAASDNMNLDQFEKATNLLDPNWMDSAACQDMDLNMFFDYDERKGPTIQTLKACQSCPVRWQCLQTVAEFESNLVTNPGKGLYAGLIPKARLRLYHNVAVKNWETASLEMLNETITKRLKSEVNNVAQDAMYRARAAKLVAQPNKRTQYCKSHNYPIVGLRSENRGAGKVLIYLCYHDESPHYVYRVNNQLLNREEYEQLCAAK